jgi:ABC-type Mn2+/Zn2+ transport system permease subunit
MPRSTWTLCGVSTTTTSGVTAAKRRPSSSIAARVFAASARSSGLHHSTIAMLPCGAIAATTSGTAQLRRAVIIAKMMSVPIAIWMRPTIRMRSMIWPASAAAAASPAAAFGPSVSIRCVHGTTVARTSA